jgi:membrane protein
MWNLVREAANDWVEDKATQQGAALAFYSLLSIAPLLVLALSIASFFFDREVVSERMVEQMRNLVGEEGGKAAESMLHSKSESHGIFATILGVGTLLFGASGVFGQMQESLNTIWEVKPKPGGGIWQLIRARFLSMSMVLGTAFLLLVSLIVSTAVAAFGSSLQSELPGSEALMHVLTFAVTAGIATLLFALIFKFLPDAKVDWHDVWAGAFFTALLFTIGKLLIGLYLGKSQVGSAYGAAGSVVVLVLWIYYSSLIMLFGAELTQVYAQRYGSRIVPKPGAEPVTANSRAQAGMTT